MHKKTNEKLKFARIHKRYFSSLPSSSFVTMCSMLLKCEISENLLRKSGVFLRVGQGRGGRGGFLGEVSAEDRWLRLDGKAVHEKLKIINDPSAEISGCYNEKWGLER